MKEILDNQYKNLFLYVPFIMAFGAGLYFSLGTEPNFHFPVLITLLCGAIILKYKNIVLRALALFAFGFFYAMSYTHIIDTPQINNSFGYLNISGEVINLDYKPESTLITIKAKANQIDSIFKDDKYLNIRVTLDNDKTIPNIHDTISGQATLFHPTSKYVPDDFDFARWAYFNNLSATGFFKDYKITTTKNNDIRNYIHQKAKSNLTDALVLGYKKTLSEKESNIWKSVGLGHVWSISGFHMTLVGGWLFALFYLILRCISPITKRIPAKYPAMICAWFGLVAYLFLSGIGVATIRAFLMTTLIFIASILGRGILTLRNASLAFLVLFFINPFFVMNAGFQLSFAAIFGLLWFFDGKEYIKRNALQRIIRFIISAFQTAIIATIFTLPFIIAHFGYLPIYSIIGNIIILPVFSFAIMPLIIIGTICALFNNFYFIDLTNHIYNFALNIAQNITSLPYANIPMPHISNTVLMLSVIGVLCIILFVKSDNKNFVLRNINYFTGIFLISLSIFICIKTPKPLFYATPDHELVGFVYDNHIKFNKAKSSNHYFAFKAWRDFNNEEQSDKNDRQKCVKGLCIYNSKNWNLAYLQNFTAIIENIEKICRNKTIDYIVAPFEINAPNCHAKILKDGLIIYPSGKITKISHHRPWHK